MCYYCSKMDAGLQGANWKAELKREILEEVKGQMREFTQEVMKEFKSVRPSVQPNHVPSNHAQLQPQENPSRQRRGQLPANMWDVEGRPICRRCQQPGHIARYCRGSPRLNVHLN